jgi:hypothetical protein
MTEFRKKMMKFRAQFEAEKRQLLNCLQHANELLDRALDPATPRDEAERAAEMAEPLMQRFEMLCDGQKPS